jgi:hypothetical protein
MTTQQFQRIVFGSNCPDKCLNINNSILHAENCVKLLGVTFDTNLDFSIQISELCKKAGRQLNVLGRLTKTRY